MDQLPLTCAPTKDQIRKLGTYPDWEWNPQPFTLQDNSQATEPHQSGLQSTINGNLS